VNAEATDALGCGEAPRGDWMDMQVGKWCCEGEQSQAQGTLCGTGAWECTEPLPQQPRSDKVARAIYWQDSNKHCVHSRAGCSGTVGAW
jgi:hypothetical protein